MPSAWMNKCGVAYRFWEDGRIEVENLGFPSIATTGREADIVRKSWARWGAAVMSASAKKGVPAPWIMGIMHIESAGNPKAVAACEPVYCPAIWNRGGCAAQGGTEKYCAGGLMAFITATARQYGRTIEYYIEHPEDQITDGADLIAKNVQRYGGDMLAAAKAYNGGSICSGGGIVNMGGQANYVEHFLKTVNGFIAMDLPMPAGFEPPATTGKLGLGAGAAVAFTLGTLAYMFADIHWGLTDKIVETVNRTFGTSWLQKGA